MKLMTFTLSGYRRFVKPTSLKLHSDLIALVGPNEAGKSSVLKALTHLNSDAPFELSEKPRRSNVEPELKWQFQLEDDDRAALADIPEAVMVERAVIVKRSDGVRTWALHPQPRLEWSARMQLAEELQGVGERISSTVSSYGESLDFPALGSVLASTERLTAEELEFAGEFALALSRVFEQMPGAEDSSVIGQDLTRLSSGIDAVIAENSQPDPENAAAQVLSVRLPPVRLFDVQDRDLQREYDLNVVADAPPAALQHLAGLAKLDLQGLRDDILNNQIADASTRRNAANRTLLEVFRSWKQEAIALQLEFQGPLLIIQVTTPADDGVSSIEERSEGMRWFATLLAFTHGAGPRPILLADEIETHLHYDAQADLVDVLSSQELTSKVIYTTHSFGCLPNDLGNGVRVVEQESIGTSVLKNGFWEKGSGFSPLLVSMGAAAVTFTPTRRAVIGEGPTEAILYPTLFRQAASISKLSFQVAPGLSSVAALDTHGLESEAGFVAYIVDGDGGGAAVASKLAKSVDENKIVKLHDPDNQDPLEIEDLVDPQEYVLAVNEEIKLWHSVRDEFRLSDVPSSMRTKAVDAWAAKHKIEAPDKAAVAQRLVNRGAETTIVADDRAELIRQTLAQLEKALEVPAE